MEISKTGGGLSLREDYAQLPFRQHTSALSRSRGQQVAALPREQCGGGFRIILPHCFSAIAEKQLVGRQAGAFNRCPEKIIKFFRVPTIIHSRPDLQFENTVPRVTEGMTQDPTVFRAASHQEQKIKAKKNE